jgi:flagellar hook-length control protein FliK
MSQTNIDYLFQVVAPTADRGPGTSRTGSDASGFDNHLSQASASVFDVLHSPDASRARGSQSPANRDDTTRVESTRRDGTRREDSGSDHTVCPPPPNSSAASSQSRTSSSSEVSKKDVDDDSEDVAAGDETASAAAGASTVKTTQTESAAKDKDSNQEHEAVEEAKAILEADPAAAAKSKAGVKGAAAAAAVEGQTDGVTTEPESNKKNTPGAAPTAIHAAEFEKVPSSSEDVATPAQHVKGVHHESNDNLKDAQHTATADTNAKAKSSDAVNGSATAPTAQVNLETSQATEESKSAKSDDSSTDNSGSDAKPSNRAEATASKAKPEPTAIANNIAANLAKAVGENESTKDGADGSTKSVGAKQETAVGPLGRALKSATDITRGTHHSSDSEMQRVDPARFVSRVSRAFQTANERGGTLQLRLSPPELGSLKLQLTVKDGVMSAQMETENASARRVLLEHLPSLRDRLAEQNIRIERFDVDVRQENNSGQANPHGSNQNPYQPQPEQTGNERRGGSRVRAEEPSTPKPIVVSQRISSTGINLVI